MKFRIDPEFPPRKNTAPPAKRSAFKGVGRSKKGGKWQAQLLAQREAAPPRHVRRRARRRPRLRRQRAAGSRAKVFNFPRRGERQATKQAAHRSTAQQVSDAAQGSRMSASRGVSWAEANRKWQAQLWHSGKQHYYRGARSPRRAARAARARLYVRSTYDTYVRSYVYATRARARVRARASAARLWYANSI